MTDQIEAPTEEKAAPRTRAPKGPPALPRDIVSIIPKIREDLGAIAKEDEPTAGTKYKYRGHDQIINAIVPLLNRYGVFTTVEDELLRYEGRAAANGKYVTAAVIRKVVTFWAPDGSSVSSAIVAESTDLGNKAVGQAQTYAERYAYTQTFTIPTGEADPDSNAEDNPGAAEAPAAAPAQPQAAAPSDDEIKELKGEIAAAYRAIGITAKEDIQAHGTAYFNGREGWDKSATPLRKLLAAIQAGDESAIGK